jgi:cytochrome P450
MTVIFDESVAEVDPWSIPLEDMDVANPYLFSTESHWAWFKRLREEAPVHYCTTSEEFGPYWSVSSYQEVMEVDTSNDIFSSEPNITIANQEEDFPLPMFIAMDEPKHSQQRADVNPAVGSRNLPNFAELIRQRTREVLDDLPVGETFNWVDKVSIELTTRMLATLFDFPYEDRAKLTRWSDVATSAPGMGVVEDEEQRQAELLECLEYFTRLWNERVNKEPGFDMVSMLAHGEATRNMTPMEYLGNLVLLIVGGNDTTRNSMTGSVLALNQFPMEYDKLRENHKLIPSMVSETIRWQTPLAHMRRVAKVDTVRGGQQIKAGDKVVMWYISGNRDEKVFENPDQFIIGRPNVRKHLSFGYGVHRCMGSHLAELQLKILWEEILARFDKVEVVGAPERSVSVFVKGYTELPVRLHLRQG